ncbi:Hypothetical predicted protein [Olea europaea subsp. europaea]|uniref:Uncharacterized protein n=1 Tax=Olea europaea subsp. europaea TaxID=158383 RepID=A0A8S0V9Z1_OLEEU|nr:Hypothetical predicted protein [Olea europaea subsp. europaea]
MARSDGEDKEIGFRLILQLAGRIPERDDIDVGLYNGTKIVCLEQRFLNRFLNGSILLGFFAQNGRR